MAGTFDIRLTFSPDTAFFVTAADGLQAAPPAEGLSMRTALRDQLGLKLESGRGPVAVFVIERAERPAED